MPEVNTNGSPFPLTVERNGVTVTLELQKYKRGVKKEQGEEYPGLKVTEENVDEIGNWLGKDNKVSLFRGRINQRLQNLYKEACTALNDKGEEIPKEFDINEFTELVKAFSARGETMEDIKNEIEDLTEEFSNLDWASGPVAAARAQEIAEKIKQLRIARESKKRDRAPATTAEPATAKA